MRYSRGTASLLSTVFTFQARSVAAVDIFDQTSNEAVVDAGVLTLPDSGAIGTNNDVAPSSLVTIASTCDEGNIVTCVNGFDVNSPGGATSCYESCGGDCCFYGGSDACIGFTGKVCKDGSCSGAVACEYANIPLVVNSCIGYWACTRAGFYDGSIGNVIDSCNDRFACVKAGYAYGSIRNVHDSCNGYIACATAGAQFASIGNIYHSCNGDRACLDLGYYIGQVGDVINSCGAYACERAASNGGTIGSITNSCDGYGACIYLGTLYGDVGNILNSCNSLKACYVASRNGGSIEGMTGSCNNSFACYDLGSVLGKVGFVTDSCTGESSCSNAGTFRGSIGSISQSCNAENSCRFAGNGQPGAITSNLKSCCNTLSTPGVCEYATELTLPAQCTHRSKVRQ